MKTKLQKVKGAHAVYAWGWMRRCVGLIAVAGLASCGSDAGTPEPSAPQIERFEASPAVLPTGGGNATLSWTVRGATRVQLDPVTGVVADSSTLGVRLQRPARYTLTATGPGGSSSATVVVRVAVPPLDARVDPAVASAQRLQRADGRAVPLFTSRDAEGRSTTFVADELVVTPRNTAELDDIVRRLGAQVVGNDAVPEPSAALGLNLTEADRAPRRWVLRVNPTDFSPGQLVANAALAGLGGALAVSSQDGLNLVAMAAAEVAGGRAVVLNPVASSDTVLNAAAECNLPGCVPDAFAEPAFGALGSRANVLGAWQMVAAGAAQRRVRLAVLDGGFFINPTDGRPNAIGAVGHDMQGMVGQYDFDADRARVGARNPATCTGGTDCPWHGHGAASVAVGTLNNGQAAAGTGGQVADALLFHVRLDRAQVARALRTARAWRADVVNMSFGLGCDALCFAFSWLSDPVAEAVAEAHAAGLVLVAAAGNDRRAANDVEPCALPGVLCVGALVNGSSLRRDYSNFGAAVDIYAPTDLSIANEVNPAMGTRSFGGTSASAPFVAGIVAMMRAVNPSLGPDATVDALLRTAWRDSPDPVVARTVNALAAVREVAGQRLPADSLEAGAGTPPLATRVDDLNLHDTGDRDDYRFTVTSGVQLRSSFTYASQLGELAPRLTMVRGCGRPPEAEVGANPSPGGLTYNVFDRLPPGQYEISLLGYQKGTSGALRPRDLTSYSMFWELRADPAPAVPMDGREWDDVALMAVPAPQGYVESRTIHSATDEDHFRVTGFQGRAGPLELNGYFQIVHSDVPLRLTLLHSDGSPAGTSVQGDLDCREPLGLHIPAGDYVVRVQAQQGGTGRYQVSYGRGIAGVFVPHAPLKWEVRHGIPIREVLFEPVAHHLFVPIGQENMIQVLGDGVGLALRDAQGNWVAEGQRAAGFDGLVLPLQQLQLGHAYFIELRHPDAQPGDMVGGVAQIKLPSRQYQLYLE